jgi:diguanylate cyclase (GGDEF)-like protein/PAS domain S-box-containing protein
MLDAPAMSLPTDAAFLEAMPDALLIVDGGGAIVFANSATERLLGWAPGTLRGESVDRLVPSRFAKHASLREGFMKHSVRRPMGAGLELFAQRRDGSEVPVDIAISPVTLDGQPHVVVALRDVSRQTQASQQLRILSVAIDAAASGVVITDRRGVIVWANPAAVRMTGYGVEELVGQSTALLKSGRHPPEFYAQLWQTVLSGVTWQGAIINRRKDGTEYHEEQTIAPVSDRAGQVTHFIAIKQDVTARVVAEAALRETRDELTRRVAEVEALHAQLREQALRDPLTGLFNRRYLDETLPRELARAGRDDAPLALVVIDIDHFKRINDTWGHHVGDLALAALGKLLGTRSRTSDVACRFGGEEFVMVLPGARLDDAVRCAEVWRHALQEVVVPAGESAVRITISAGVAAWKPGESAEQLFARADQALYAAKRDGRDRVVSASASTAASFGRARDTLTPRS